MEDRFISARVPADLADEFGDIARHHGRTFSAQLRLCMAALVAVEKRDEPPVEDGSIAAPTSIVATGVDGS